MICLAGLFIGLILRELDDVRDFITFSPEVFFTILLPPIILLSFFSPFFSFFFQKCASEPRRERRSLLGIPRSALQKDQVGNCAHTKTQKI